MTSSDEIREAFLSYFEEKGHRRVKSGSLVPKSDPTLLFTNAGMNQFKDVFLGFDKREYVRATSSQKCMRVSGKHNDLEQVGRTPRHHTFFEMLGNFSFGDYFKKEAIRFAWQLCTEIYSLDKNKLIITVFEEDTEAFEIWRDEIGIPSERLLKCGEDENFWAMGDTGPCGPCSELHYDLGERIGDTSSEFGEDSDRYVEIWNLVFMQYDRDSSGRKSPLPSPSIDTGMGLERIACVLQGVASNYETDLFKPILVEAARFVETRYGQDEDVDTSLRILADHSRACMFLIDEGVVPGNEGKGYVLRKILRRAIRHGQILGMEQPFIYTLTSLVGELMGDSYPELLKSREYAAKVVKHEEERFSATLTHGMNLLEEVFRRVQDEGGNSVPGESLFRLYDTFGFPFDLAVEIATERGLTVDESGFRKELAKQRDRARASWKGGEASVPSVYRELAAEEVSTEFTGYDSTENVPGHVLGILKDGERVDTLAEGEEGELVFDRTPFYSESGGQVADQGTLENDLCQGEVTNVQNPLSVLRVHTVKLLHGDLRVGDEVALTVDPSLRRRTTYNHTATHLLQAALREVLGEHVKQSGSLVAPDRLRFDFSHYKSLTAWEIREIEERVNERIRRNIEVKTELRELDEAINSGAMALFGEKYDEKVRVVTIPGYSMELCGGTHVQSTGEISLFKITSESSIAAGIRRVEAVTGSDALNLFLEDEEILQKLTKSLLVQRGDLVSTVERLSSELKESGKRAEKLQLELAQRDSGDALESVRKVHGIKVMAQKVENLDRNAMRRLADQIKNRMKSGVVVLGTAANGRVGLIAMVTEDLTGRIKADELIQKVARIVDGGGGGKPDMAEAGGKNAAALEEALQKTYDLVAELVANSG